MSGAVRRAHRPHGRVAAARQPWASTRAHAAYSPLGVVYGFCADLFSNMVLNTLRSPSSPDLSLEDLFNSRERLEAKQTQADEWERLPKREGEAAPFEHTTEWAAQMYARMIGSARGTCCPSRRTERVEIPEVFSLCCAAWRRDRLAGRWRSAGRYCLGAGALLDVGCHASALDRGDFAAGGPADRRSCRRTISRLRTFRGWLVRCFKEHPHDLHEPGERRVDY